MSKEDLYVHLAAILTTLAECQEPTSESMLYLAVGMEAEKWELLRACLVGGGLVHIKNYRVSLTLNGRVAAAKINQTLAENNHVVHYPLQEK